MLQIEVQSGSNDADDDSTPLQSDLRIHKLLNEKESVSAPSISVFPLNRVEKLGRGSSSVVYKSVLLNQLTVCAEKVVVVADPAKKIQLYRELESLKIAFSNSGDGSSGGNCSFIVRLLEVLTNPFDGTLSICLEYMNGGSLQDVVKYGGCRNERVLSSISFQLLSGYVVIY
jgi:serine/threonine protein kinase